MKKFIISFFTLALVFSFTFSFAQEDNLSAEKIAVDKNTKVEVYYFHGTRRCETCKSVGKVSKELVEYKYTNNSNVKFIEIDYDQKGNETLVKKFEVTSSGLYVYNQIEFVNLTTYAFQYARTNPDKLRIKLKSTINKYLK